MRVFVRGNLLWEQPIGCNTCLRTYDLLVLCLGSKDLGVMKAEQLQDSIEGSRSRGLAAWSWKLYVDGCVLETLMMHM